MARTSPSAVHTPGRRRGVSAVSRVAGAPGGPARAATRARGGARRDRHGRAATSAPSSCPTPTSRSSSTRPRRSGRVAARRSAGSTRTAPRRATSSTQLRRRDDLDRNRDGRAAPAGRRRDPHRHRRQRVRGDGRRRRGGHPRGGAASRHVTRAAPVVSEAARVDRLDGHLTPLIRDASRSGRGRSPAASPGSESKGRSTRSRGRAGHPRRQPHLQRGRRDPRGVADQALGRRIHWLGKKEMFDWPIVGWVAPQRRRRIRSTAGPPTSTRSGPPNGSSTKATS